MKKSRGVKNLRLTRKIAAKWPVLLCKYESRAPRSPWCRPFLRKALFSDLISSLSRWDILTRWKFPSKAFSVGTLLSCLYSRVYNGFQGKVLHDSKCLLSARDLPQKRQRLCKTGTASYWGFFCESAPSLHFSSNLHLFVMKVKIKNQKCLLP